MDTISGLADHSNRLASFLKIAEKHQCVYIFHSILPEKEIWKKNYIANENFLHFSSLCSISNYS